MSNDLWTRPFSGVVIYKHNPSGVFAVRQVTDFVVNGQTGRDLFYSFFSASIKDVRFFANRSSADRYIERELKTGAQNIHLIVGTYRPSIDDYAACYRVEVRNYSTEGKLEPREPREAQIIPFATFTEYRNRRIASKAQTAE